MRNMKSSIIRKNKLIMGDITLRKILMILCGMFRRTHLSSIRKILFLEVVGL